MNLAFNRIHVFTPRLLQMLIESLNIKWCTVYFVVVRNSVPKIISPCKKVKSLFTLCTLNGRYNVIGYFLKGANTERLYSHMYMTCCYADSHNMCHK